MNTDDLIARHPAVWAAATNHAFLERVRTGTLPEPAFRTWLAQDYLFVGDLLVFQARLLARSPRPAQAVVAAGAGALVAELAWFEEHAQRLSLKLDVPRKDTTEAYRRLLVRLDQSPYPVAITALWATERAYLEAWSGAAPGAAAYRELVEHWTVPEFAEYVDGLRQAANAALQRADDPRAVEDTFLDVARMESAFWKMALAAGTT